MTTDRYKPAMESKELNPVIHALWSGRKRAGEIAEETDSALSTVSTKMQALERDGLATKDKWYYELNKEEIYTRFVTQLLDELKSTNRPYRNRQIEAIADDLFWHEEIRRHLEDFLEYELKTAEKPLNGIFQKYRQNDIIRLNLIYQVAETPPERIPEDKQDFWEYLTILQAWLNRGVWTETQHAVALQSQVFPHEEQSMATLNDAWNNIQSRASSILDERISESVKENARMELIRQAKGLERFILDTLLDEGRVSTEELRERYVDDRDPSAPTPHFNRVLKKYQRASVIEEDDGEFKLAIAADRVKDNLSVSSRGSA